MGSLSFLQGIFPTQGCGPRSAALQADSLTAEPPGKPRNPGVVSVQFSSVQSLSRVRPFVTPRNAARQASLSITNSRSLPKLMSIESVMTSSHLILCGITVYLRMYSDFKWHCSAMQSCNYVCMYLIRGCQPGGIRAPPMTSFYLMRKSLLTWISGFLSSRPCPGAPAPPPRRLQALERVSRLTVPVRPAAPHAHAPPHRQEFPVFFIFQNALLCSFP